MFRDFGLETDEQRRCLLTDLEGEQSLQKSSQPQIFIRVSSTTNAPEEENAELA